MEGKFLFLVVKHQDGHWSFPKGHKDGLETDIESAKRELYEETGIKNIDIKNEKFEVSYEYEKNNIREQKTVYYFLAEVLGESEGIPENFKNEILENEFVSLEEAKRRINFENYNDLLEKLKNIFL